MKILIDTNFALTCAKRKIDFVSLADELFSEKIEWIIPVEVVLELEKISNRKGEKIEDKLAAGVALGIIKQNGFETIKLGNKNVDDGIVNVVNKQGLMLATMDSGLKKRVGSNILTVRAEKRLEII